MQKRYIIGFWAALGIFAGPVGLVSSLSTNAEATEKDVQLGVDESLIDSKVNPCDDFYQYSCGKWLAKTEIPADQSGWDRSFVAITERNRVILKKILEDYEAGKKVPENPYSKKLGDFYAACMDEKAIESRSLASLKEDLKNIDSLNASGALFASLIAKIHLKGVNAFFDFGDQQDFKNSTQVIGVVDQAGLGLPDRDYYLKNDAKTLEVRKLYEKHIAKVYGLLGDSPDDSQKKAEAILKIETALASHSMSRVDRRDPDKIYHRLERKGLKQKMPGFDWDQYFKESGVPDVQAINVASPEFFVGLNELLSSISPEDLKTYLKWHFVTTFTQALPKRFVDEDFDFSSRALSGQKQLSARWKRCVKAADRMMGFALGRSFVEESYGSKGKVMTKDMIQKIESSFASDLEKLTWMDDATRKEAKRKIHSVFNKVGYPDKWRKYDSLSVDRSSYLKTLVNADEFNSHYHLNKIGKPLDRQDWEMSPPTVNAYYDPSMNEMVFPAGILQLPFFNRKMSMSMNYGGIGMVMGHELTHGFDDEGRHYNADGNLVDWWSPSVSKAFNERAECVVKEYDSFEALPGLHLNGKLTLGENIADHGGIKLAYQAWKNSTPNTEMATEMTTKMNDDKKFFLSFAQSWCSKKRDELTRMLVAVDPHSPARFRVNGTLSQFPEFATAYQCKPGAPMAPINRCVVW